MLIYIWMNINKTLFMLSRLRIIIINNVIINMNRVRTIIIIIILPYQGNLFFLWGKLVYYIFHRADSWCQLLLSPKRVKKSNKNQTSQIPSRSSDVRFRLWCTAGNQASLPSLRPQAFQVIYGPDPKARRSPEEVLRRSRDEPKRRTFSLFEGGA